MTINNSVAARSSVPKIKVAQVNKHQQKKSGHGMFMMACCVVMIAAFGFAIFTAPSEQGLGATFLASLPLLGCVGAHLIMYKFMGKSCHGANTKDKNLANSENRNSDR